MRFSAFFVLATAAVSGFAQTVSQVRADIADIAAKVTALDTAITNYPATGGTLAGALAIHNSAVALNTAINKATTDTNNTPASAVTATDGQNILNDVNAFVPTIQHALQQIVVKKPAFDALPLGNVSALVKQDLANLRTSTYAFATALIAKAPTAALVSQATALRAQIDGYFATAQAGYP